MTYETILTDRVGNVLKLTLNRPERLNAASIPLADELSAAFYDLGDARAVVITGAGKGFCSGADLAARGEASAIQQKGGSHLALQNHYNPLVTQILRCPVPVCDCGQRRCGGRGLLDCAGWRISCWRARAPISFRLSSTSGWFPMADRPGCWPARSAAPAPPG